MWPRVMMDEEGLTVSCSENRMQSARVRVLGPYFRSQGCGVGAWCSGFLKGSCYRDCRAFI